MHQGTQNTDIVEQQLFGGQAPLFPWASHEKLTWQKTRLLFQRYAAVWAGALACGTPE